MVHEDKMGVGLGTMVETLHFCSLIKCFGTNVGNRVSNSVAGTKSGLCLIRFPETALLLSSA